MENTFTWEQKTELCRLLNAEQNEAALDLVIENIDNMDEQAWDMFFNGVSLAKEDINKLMNKHKIIAEKVKDNQTDNFRTAMRMAAYEELVLGEQ